jgi:hypothetical protein
VVTVPTSTSVRQVSAGAPDASGPLRREVEHAEQGEGEQEGRQQDGDPPEDRLPAFGNGGALPAHRGIHGWRAVEQDVRGHDERHDDDHREAPSPCRRSPGRG